MRHNSLNAKGLIARTTFALLVFAVPIAAMGQADAPQDRTSNKKSCADVFILLGRLARHERQLEPIGITPENLPENTIYVSGQGGGHAALWLPGNEPHLDLVVTRLADAANSVRRAIKYHAERGNSIVITGDQALPSLVRFTRQFVEPEDWHRIWFSVEPQGEIAHAKHRLLQNQYSKIELLFLVDTSSYKPQEVARFLLATSEKVSSPSSKCDVILASDLPGNASQPLADRLSAFVCSPDVFRMTFIHQGAGRFWFPDGSSISVGEYSRQRLSSLNMELTIGCCMPATRAGWLFVDEPIFVRDVQRMTNAMSEMLRARETASGAELVDAATQAGGGKMSRLLSLLPFALAASLSESDKVEASTTQPAEGNLGGGRSPVNKQSGFAYSKYDLETVAKQVGGEKRWFSGVKELRAISYAIYPEILDRNIVWLDIASERIVFFRASRHDGYAVPSPVFSGPLTGTLTKDERNALLAHRAAFWIVRGVPDAMKGREVLLEWQSRNNIELPFLFFDATTESPRTLWGVLKPFLEEATHSGEALPKQEEEAWACGLFWCDSHKTNERLSQYRVVQVALQAKRPVSEIAPVDTQTLASLWHDSNKVIWLFGVWNNDRIVTPHCEVKLEQWIGDTSCEARIAFVSPYPVSTRVSGRYFENARDSWLATGLADLIELNQRNESRDRIIGQLEGVLRQCEEKSGFLGVSTCGKYFLASE